MYELMLDTHAKYCYLLLQVPYNSVLLWSRAQTLNYLFKICKAVLYLIDTSMDAVQTSTDVRYWTKDLFSASPIPCSEPEFIIDQ